MNRVSLFNHPLLLGFDQLERALDRISKQGDNYPPYNIEEQGEGRLRITLAVAGFAIDDLDIRQEDNQLVVRGKQNDDANGRAYLYRGIAARQFQKSFLLAEGVEVAGAALENGLLHIDLNQRPVTSQERRIEIRRSGVHA
ncbi:MAG: Hsp20 family protein [Rhodospirillaceae bacterium]|nr:Hsp20 family protein [Rhodospirillaceae bacterium]